MPLNIDFNNIWFRLHLISATGVHNLFTSTINPEFGISIMR